MFSKVANRLRRRSPQEKLPSISPTQELFRVDVAPELLRWSDFSTPFPTVSMGGYSRFYATYTISKSTSTASLDFCPLLSQQPEPSPSSEVPLKSPLFATLHRPCLPVIPEVSLESLIPTKPRNLTISTGATPHSHSLKRRGRRLLRTPSIERDFVHGRCQSPSDTSITISELSATSSTDIAPSPRSPSSSDTNLCHDRSDSNHSEFPITPSTSIDSENDDKRFSIELLDDKFSIHNNESESVITRPISSMLSSFCTAQTEFSEI